MAPSAAMARMQDSAGRVLEHFGTRRRFRLWTATKNRLKGETTWAPTATEARARCDFETLTFRRDDGKIERRRVLLVEVHPTIEAAGGMLSDWRVFMDDGVERKLSPAGQLAGQGGRSDLSEDGTYYVVEVEGGG